MEGVSLGVMVEPPVSVANSLLEASRRFATEVEARQVKVQWIDPRYYAATLLVVAGDPDAGAEVLADRLRGALMPSEECPVQLTPLTLELLDGRPDVGVVYSTVTTRGDELAKMIEAVAASLAIGGLECEALAAPRVPVAVIRDEASVAAVAELLKEPKDVPVAGWLLGGLCTARMVRTDEGIWLPSRVRYVPLRRLNARREG